MTENETISEKICQKCGKVLNTRWTFCPECGETNPFKQERWRTETAIRCKNANCRARIRSTMKYCTHCGTEQ